jgi:hypothetical protein
VHQNHFFPGATSNLRGDRSVAADDLYRHRIGGPPDFYAANVKRTTCRGAEPLCRGVSIVTPHVRHDRVDANALLESDPNASTHVDKLHRGPKQRTCGARGGREVLALSLLEFL